MDVRTQTDRVRILAVDDEEDTLGIYRQALCPAQEREESAELAGLQARLFGQSTPHAGSGQGSGRAFDLITCRQGDAAVKAVRENLAAERPFAVVFMDIRMPPGPDGVWAAEQIRKLDPNIEIVMTTAHSDRAPQEIAAAIQPSHKLLYLKKPVHLDEIRQFAAALADKWEQERLLVQARCDLEAHVANLQQAHELLHKSQERYELVVRGTNDGVWDWDLADNRIYFSDRWLEIVGLRRNEIGDTPEDWLDLVHADDHDALRAALDAHLHGRTERFNHEHRLLYRDGSYRWVGCRALSVRDSEGRAVRMAGSMTDITERKRLEGELLHSAYHDSLTGLANRSFFMDRLRWAVEKSRRCSDYLFAVLYLDLDRFKVINDSLGHAAGDQLLIAVSRRIQKHLRAVDTFARLGGDEFTVLLDDIADPVDATRVADRVLQELTRPVRVEGHEVFTSASIGIITSGGSHLTAEEILRDADIAMYRAKGQGKARYEVFDAETGARIHTRLQLETDLRHAIERQEFVLHYQPITSLKTGSIVGFEALVRWQQPERGLVSPAEFIPLAEETGLILPLEDWVLGEASQQLHEWHEQFPQLPDLSVSVNISSRHFGRADFSDQVTQLLERTGIDGSHLKLEITESALIENLASAAQTLERLQALSVAVQVDDFGTGYSSLSYLHQLPLNTLKIDRSFVSKMCSDRNSREIVQTIVLLARALGMDLVAEGIEGEEQAHQLHAMGCQYGQGFFFQRPLPSDAATRLIEQMPVR